MAAVLGPEDDGIAPGASEGGSGASVLRRPYNGTSGVAGVRGTAVTGATPGARGAGVRGGTWRPGEFRGGAVGAAWSGAAAARGAAARPAASRGAGPPGRPGVPRSSAVVRGGAAASGASSRRRPGRVPNSDSSPCFRRISANGAAARAGAARGGVVPGEGSGAGRSLLRGWFSGAGRAGQSAFGSSS
jgi:hypothetical protein